MSKTEKVKPKRPPRPNKFVSDPGQLAVAQKFVPPRALRSMGKPLLRGEREADFDLLLQSLAEDLKPRSFYQWVTVYDIAQLLWQAARLRRVEASLLDSTEESPEAFQSRYSHLSATEQDKAFNDRLDELRRTHRDPMRVAVREWTQPQEKPSRTPLCIATAVKNNIDLLERVGQQITKTDLRRDYLFRDIKRQQANDADQQTGRTIELVAKEISDE